MNGLGENVGSLRTVGPKPHSSLWQPGMLGDAYNIVKEMIVKVGIVTIWDVGTRIHLKDAVKRKIKLLLSAKLFESR